MVGDGGGWGWWTYAGGEGPVDGLALDAFADDAGVGVAGES
jgi:hypothetical protein